MQAAGIAARAAIAHCSVVVGNRTECEMAIGLSDPDKIADKFLADGVTLAIVKLGAEGVMLATSSQRIRIAPCRSNSSAVLALAMLLVERWRTG